LFSAAGALTLSGIALGYQGFTDAGSAARRAPLEISVPVPSAAVPRLDGGHPDLFTALSTQIIARVQEAQAAIQALPLPIPGLAMPPLLMNLPQPLPEPVILSVVIEPLADEVVVDESATLTPDEPVVAELIAPGPLLAARALDLSAVIAMEEASAPPESTSAPAPVAPPAAAPRVSPPKPAPQPVVVQRPVQVDTGDGDNGEAVARNAGGANKVTHTSKSGGTSDEGHSANKGNGQSADKGKGQSADKGNGQGNGHGDGHGGGD
jgi:hypothetical protein